MPLSILCVGAALGDLLLKESDEFLGKFAEEKGGMTLVDMDKILSVMNESEKAVQAAPGGSACNTAVGLARLGGRSSFLGKRGEDDLGGEIHDQLEQWGVHCRYLKTNTPTGRVLSMITPDAQRTMFTYLGASSELGPHEVEEVHFDGVDIVHLEGYLLFNRDLALKVIDLAKASGARVSLDLASFEVVRANQDILEDLLRDKIDIIIANEDEAKEYSSVTPHESLERFADLAEIAVVKLGKDGVLIARGEERHEVPGQPTDAVDTTGAGDLWASGFLYGLSHDWELDKAGRLGNRMGSSVVSVIGAVIPEDSYENMLEGF